MSLTITKSYEENIELKPFHFAKVSISISSDKALNSPAEVEDMSNRLGAMAKGLVRKELAQLREQAQQQA